MSKVVRTIFVVAALGSASDAFAQRPSPQARQPQSTQPQASPAEQLETCRRNVTQLDEQLRAQQKKLTSLRNERKTVGSSGGEVARFKLASLDQEIRELSRQSQNLITQIDAEGSRCEQLAARVSGTKPDAPAQQPTKPQATPRGRQ